MNLIDKMIEKFIKLNRKMRQYRRFISVLSAIVVFVTTYAMILPAVTLDSRTASMQNGIKVAASTMDPDEGGTIFGSALEEEPAEEEEEPAAEEEEPADTADEGTDDSGSSEEEDGSEPEDVPDDAGEEEADLPEQDTDEDAEEEASSADYSTAEQAAADEETPADEEKEGIRLITEETQLVFKAKDYTVYADFDAGAKLPEGVELQVKEITKDSDPEIYEEYYKLAVAGVEEKYDEDKAVSFAKFYDINFLYSKVQEDGSVTETAVEPEGEVRIRIEYRKDVELQENTEVEAIHFVNENGEAETPEEKEQKTPEELARQIAEQEKPQMIDSETEGTDGSVKAVEFRSDQFSVYGIVGTEPVTVDFLTSDGEQYEVTVSFGEDAEIPQGASLVVSEVGEDDDDYDDYEKQTAEAVGSDVDELSYIRLLDIRIVDKDGQEVTIGAPVDVKIRLRDTEGVEGTPGVVHFGEDVEVVDAAETRNDDDGSEISFTASGFSVYGVVYYVSLTFELDGAVYSYDLDGGTCVSVSTLIRELNINQTGMSDSEFLGSIADVESTNEDKLAVVKADENTSFAELKGSLHSEPIYSAELSEEQIQDALNQNVSAGDWAVFSMRPFSSEERLVLTMDNGDQFVIWVTDDQEGAEPEVPRQADGSNIENISAKWITEDTVDNESASLLYVRPVKDELQSVRLQVNYALSGEHDYEPGDVTITIPSYIFKNRAGMYYGKLTIPYPEDPDATGLFNWKKVGDSYILTNTKRMSAATKGYIQFGFDEMDPRELVDMEESAPFDAYIEVITHRGNTIALRSNSLTAQFDTEAKVTSVVKRVYDRAEIVPASRIPENQRIPGEEKYVLVRWYMWGVTEANTEYTLDHLEYIPQDEIVINEDGIDKTEADFHGFVVSADSDSASTSLEKSVYTGYADGRGSYYYYSTAYPLSDFKKDTKYTLHNRIKYTVTESDPEVAEPVNPNVNDGDPDPRLVTEVEARAAATFSYSDPKWDAPSGHFMVDKNGNDDKEGNNQTHRVRDEKAVTTSDLHLWARAVEDDGWYGIYPSALNDLQDAYKENGTDGSIRVSYTIDSIGYVMPWMFDETRTEPVSSRLSKNYCLPVTMATEDRGVSIGRNTDKLTVLEDYTFESVELPEDPYVYKGVPKNINPDGSWIAESAGDGTFKYNRDSDKAHWPDIVLEIQRGGNWETWATASWKSGSFSATLHDGSVSSDRVIDVPSDTENFRTVVTLQNMNVSDEATDNVCWQAAIDYDIRPVINLKSTDSMISLISDMFEETNLPEFDLWNTVNMSAYDSASHSIVSITKDGYDLLRGYTTDIIVYPSKESKSTMADVDYTNRYVTIHYSAKVEERSVINDKKTYEQAIEDGRIVPETQGVWRDLLPAGVTPVLSTIKLRDNDQITRVYTVENYKDSGRTLLVVEADLSPATEKYEEDYFTYYANVPSISFDARYSFEGLYDYGQTPHNVISFESGNSYIGTVEGFSGEPDDPYGNGNVSTERAFENEQEKVWMKDLDPQRDAPAFVYAGTVTNINNLSEAQVSLHKDVMVNNDGRWSQGTYYNDPDGNRRDVYEGGTYSYRLSMISAVDTITKDMVLYDSLENYEAVNGNDDIDIGAPRWRGTFKGVDLNVLLNAGCAPVVYYSTTPNLQLADETDPRKANTTNTDLNNGSIWTKAAEYTGSLSDVKAIAIDMRKKTDGSEFILQPMDIATAYIRMQAPSGAEATGYIQADAHAYNNIYLTANTIDQTDPQGHDAENFVRHDYTKIGLKQYNYTVSKVWDDNDDRDGKRPDTITITLYRNGEPDPDRQPVTLPIMVDGQKVWQYTFEDLPYTDPDGNRYIYSAHEEPVDGYTTSYNYSSEEEVTITNRHEPEKTSISGDKQWIGDTEDARPSSIQVKLYANGQYLKQSTVKAAEDGTWNWSFDNLYKYENGEEIEYTVEETVTDTKGRSYITVIRKDEENDHVYHIENTYHPYGDLWVNKTVEDVTPVSAETEFGFTFEFTRTDEESGDTVPVLEPYEYDIMPIDSEEIISSGTVTSGDVIRIKGGQRIHVRQIDEYVDYTVTEEDLPGFTKTAEEGSSGTIEPNEEKTAEFTNKYAANGEAELAARKTLENRELQRGLFRFEVYEVPEQSADYSVDGTLVRMANNQRPDNPVLRPDGTVSESSADVLFGAFRYTQDDLGIHWYKIVEKDTENSGYTYDHTVYRAKVEVTDNGDGTLNCVRTYYNEQGEILETSMTIGGVEIPVVPVRFTNSYEAYGDLPLTAWKAFNGRDLTAGEFTFELLDQTGTVVGETANNENGTVTFNPDGIDGQPGTDDDISALKFSHLDIGKTVFFFAREKEGTDATVTYSKEIFGYAVTVVDNGDGTLSFNQVSVDVSDLYVGSKCTGCGGTGKVADPITGDETECGSCGGTGSISTWNPDWTGYKTCEACGGEGTVTENEQVVDCDVCGGTGSVLNKTGTVSVFINGLKPGSLSITKTTADAPEDDTTEFRFKVVLTGEGVEELQKLEYDLYQTDSEGNRIVPDEESGNNENSGDGNSSSGSDSQNNGGGQSGEGNQNSGNGPTARLDEQGTGEPGNNKGRTGDGPAILISKGSDAALLQRGFITPNAVVTYSSISPKVKTSTMSTVKNADDQDNNTTRDGATLQGRAYVLYNRDNKELIFFRSNEDYQVNDPNWNNLSNYQEETYSTIDGGTVTGMVINSDLESSYSGSWETLYRKINYETVTFRNQVRPKDTYRLFYDSNVKTINNIENLDTSNVTSMSGMFFGCSGLTELDVTHFDTSNVTSMSGMFYGCRGLTELDVTHFDTSKVSSMSGMFSQCGGLTELDVTNFDTSNVTNMTSMFRECFALTDLDVTNFDTSNVTNMSSMFWNCSGLKSKLDVTNFVTSNVTNMSEMFYNCNGLTELDVTHFDTSNVTNMSSMFNQCGGLTELDVTNFVTSNVTEMNKMFCGCSGLTELDVTHFDTSKVTNMESMFDGCSGLTELDVTHFDTSNVTNMSYMFYRCSGLTKLDVTHFDTSKVTDMSSMFSYCSGLTELDVTHFDTSKVTNMSAMFNHCRGLTKLDVTHFDTSNVTEMVSMFYDCNGLTELDVTNFDTSKVSSMSSMFNQCGGLTELDVTHFDTSNVRFFNSTFCNCRGLTELDISSFDMTKAENCSSFLADTPLKKITIGEKLKYVNKFYLNQPSTQSPYTGLWIQTDGPMVGTTAALFSNKYSSSAADYYNNPASYSGTWEWESTEYTITFNRPAGVSGSMSDMKCAPDQDVTITNEFIKYNHHFVGFVDQNGRQFTSTDNSTVSIPANTYGVKANVTLTPLFEKDKHQTSIEDGTFYITLHGQEQAVISNLPAGTKYQIYEETPDGWVLIEKSGDNGEIHPLETSEARFKNRYEPAKAQFYSSKTLDGEPAEADEFTFALYNGFGDSKGEEPVETKTNGAGGEIRFSEITYSTDGWAEGQTSKEYVYTIQEVPGDDPDIEYDDQEVKVTVTVTKNEEGGLSVSTQYDPAGYVFKNRTKTPPPPTTGSLTVTKHVEPETAGEGKEFSFELLLTAANGMPYTGEITIGDQAQTPDSGVVAFTLARNQSVTISGLPAGTHYAIRETNLASGWTMSSSENISGEITGGGDAQASFTNTYTAHGNIILEAHKRLEGDQLEADRFTFELFRLSSADEQLTDGSQPIMTATNGTVDEVRQEEDEEGHTVDNPWYGTAVVYFDPIEFTQDEIGQHYFAIRERRSSEDNTVTYDEHIETVTVTVADDNGSGVLTVTPEYDKNGALFVNTVNPGDLKISKVIAEDTLEPPAEAMDTEFTFTLTLRDEDGEPLEGSYKARKYKKAEVGTNDEPAGDEFSITSGNSFTLKGGQYLLVTGLPYKSQYEVSESLTEEQQPYWTIEEGKSGSIPAGAQTEEVFTNTYVWPPSLDITIRKVNDVDQGLNGAVFEVYRMGGEDGTIPEKLTHDKFSWLGNDDTFTVSDTGFTMVGLLDGTYQLKEIKAPTGYIIEDATPLTFTITNGAVDAGANVMNDGVTYKAAFDGDKDTYSIVNKRGGRLPNSGGSGTLPYTLGGIAMMLMTAMMYAFRMRKRERRYMN